MPLLDTAGRPLLELAAAENESIVRLRGDGLELANIVTPTGTWGRVRIEGRPMTAAGRLLLLLWNLGGHLTGGGWEEVPTDLAVLRLTAKPGLEETYVLGRWTGRRRDARSATSRAEAAVRSVA